MGHTCGPNHNGTFSQPKPRWTGIAKLVEECGEVIQVCGKLMAYPDGNHPDGNHPDGKGNLETRLMEEMGDLHAALEFVEYNNSLSNVVINSRRVEKIRLFKKWEMAGIKS